MGAARRFDAGVGVRTGVDAGGARPCRCSRTRKHTQTWRAGRGRGERRSYQINERQEFPFSPVGPKRGYFEGLEVAQKRAVGQQNRHPQHLARNKRHVRQRPRQAEPRAERAGEAGRRGAAGARASRNLRDLGASRRLPRAGRRWRALLAATARPAAWRQFLRHLRHCAPGGPPCASQEAEGAPPAATGAREERAELQGLLLVASAWR